MKILLSAYACHPNRGSEPGIGWGWLKELSKINEVWVFFYAEQGQKEAVRKAVAELSYQHNIHLVPLTVPKFVQNKLYRIRYEIWQWKAYRLAKQIIRDVQIELIHHVTIAAWWNCGHLWKLDLPFIFGPISGAQTTPSVAYDFLRWHDRLYEWLRAVLFEVAWRFWKRPRHAIKEARLVIVDNPETQKRVREIRKRNSVFLFPDVGVDSLPQNQDKHKSSSSRSIIHLLWSGLLIPRKNFGLLLEALNGIPGDVEWYLRLAGDGELLKYWEKKVKQYGLQKHISFLGRVDYSQMSEQYHWADIFVFPSLREATGSVILEAMSHGLPIIALNIHGASVVLDDSCAILIPVVDRKQMVGDFRAAIITLWQDPELRRKMGEAGKRRVAANYLWEKRGERMNEIYREILCMTGNKPSK